MADPHPARGPHTSAQPAGQPVRAEVHRTEGTQYQPIIRYYKQMRTQHTYRLNVTLPRVADSRPPAATATGPVRVRPVIAGAVVNPPEAELQPGKTDLPAAFQVTPAAVGRFRDARVQLYHRDRMVAEVPLKMKGTRQTWTWVLLGLTILVPLLFVPVFGRDDWLRSTGEVKYKRAHPSAAERGTKATSGAVPNGPITQIGMGGPPRGGAAVRGDDLWNAFFGDLQPAGARGRNGGGARAARNGNGAGMGGRGRGGRGRAAAGGGRGGRAPALPDLNWQREQGASADAANAAESAKISRENEFRGTVEHAVFHVLPSWIPQKVSVPVAAGLQDGYEFVATYAINWAELPFYLAVALLLLTLGSWITHVGYPGRRRSKAITLA